MKRLASGFQFGSAVLVVCLAAAEPRSGPLQVLRRTQTAGVEGLALSPDGKLLAVGSTAPAAERERLPEGTIEVWELSTGRLQRTLRQSAWTPGFDVANSVAALAFSPDGRQLVGTDCAGHVLWDLTTGTERYTWHNMFSCRDASPAWSPDGAWLAVPWMVVSTNPPGLALIEAATGTQRAFWPVESGYIRTARFSPDGRLVATAGHDCAVRVFEVASKTNLLTDSTGQTMWVAAFSPDGRQLVAGPSWGGALLLYDVAVNDGKVTVTRKGRSSPTGEEIHLLEFTPDGRQALTVSNVGLRLWDTTTWTRSRQVPGCLGRLSADGKRVVVVRQNAPDLVEVWRLEELPTLEPRPVP